MAELMADWKELWDQPETLEQGRHSQKILAERVRLRSRLADQCQGGWEMNYRWVEPSTHGKQVWVVLNPSELLWIVGSKDCALESVVQRLDLGSEGDWQEQEYSTQSRTNAIQQESPKRDADPSC